MADPSGRPTASPAEPPPGGLTASVAEPAATTDERPAAAPGAPLPAPPGRYALGDEIARGGMGVIYRAADTALSRAPGQAVGAEEVVVPGGAAGQAVQGGLQREEEEVGRLRRHGASSRFEQIRGRGRGVGPTPPAAHALA
jgi:hypothetical protein